MTFHLIVQAYSGPEPGAAPLYEAVVLTLWFYKEHNNVHPFSDSQRGDLLNWLHDDFHWHQPPLEGELAGFIV